MQADLIQCARLERSEGKPSKLIGIGHMDDAIRFGLSGNGQDCERPGDRLATLVDGSAEQRRTRVRAQGYGGFYLFPG